MPNTPAAESDEDGAAGERRRRRRGRRGGRGRRREGRPEGAPAESNDRRTPAAPFEGAVNGSTSPEHAPAEAAHQASAAAPVAAITMDSPPPPAEVHEPLAAMAPAEPIAAPAPRAAAPVPAPSASPSTRQTEEPDMGSDELAAVAKQATEDLIKAMGFEATITASADNDRVDVAVQVSSGEHLLNGSKGETRQALQHLLNRFVNRGEGSRYHLQLEINDFWQQREKELEDMALRMAEEALAGNTECITDFLNSQERRIVHVTLKPNSRVKTYALGQGMVKRVAIAPADFPERSEEDAG
jgi:spoIIIJ-associated protein